MNGRNCQRCPDRAWVQRANQFLRENRRNPAYRAHVATIEFLLGDREGHCGINERTTIESIRRYLNDQNIEMSREEFQNQVLTELKRRGIVATLVYPGRQGGVFIPCRQEEVRQVVGQVLHRVTQLLTNLEGVRGENRVQDMIVRVRRSAERARTELSRL